jgi:hypothetical protein
MACKLWIGHKPLVGDFKVFGCTTYVFVPKKLRKKLTQNLPNQLTGP